MKQRPLYPWWELPAIIVFAVAFFGMLLWAIWLVISLPIPTPP